MKNFYLVLLMVLAFQMGCQNDPAASREEYMASAQDYMEKGQYQEASIQFRNALKVDGSHIDARYGLIRSYQLEGNHQAAIAEIHTILKTDPDNSRAKLMLGNYYLRAGTQNPAQFRNAQKLAKEILEKEPDNLEAQILLGNSYAGLDDLDRSVETMQQVLAQDPSNLAAHLSLGAFQMGRNSPEEAEKIFLDALSQHPDSPAVHRSLANFYAASERFEKAEEHFEQALELEPENQINLYSLVRFYLATEQEARAEELFQQQIETNPDDPSPRLALANFEMARGKQNDGLVRLEELHAEQPDNRDAALRLAEVYVNEKQFDRAREILESLLSKNANDPHALYLRGRIESQQGEIDQALETLNHSIQFAPGFQPSQIARAEVLLKKRDFVEAEKALRLILEVNPKQLIARAGLAKLLALTGRSEESLYEAKEVLQRDPNNIDALVARAESLFKNRQTAAARQEFQKLRSIQPRNPYFLHRLGALAAQEQQPEEAIAYFQEALSQDPDLADAINDLIAVYMADGHFEEALQDLDRFAGRSDRKDLYALFKGRLYLSRKNYDQAEIEFRQAVKSNPNNYQAYIYLSQLQVLQDDPELAIQEVDQLIEARPEFAPAYMMKAYLQELSGDQSGAVENYRKTLELTPENPIAANNLAWIYCENGENLEVARALAQEARRQDPENPHYADTLGWVYYKLGNYTLAVNQFLFMVNEGKPSAAHFHRLGMAYYRKGDTTLARQTLEKALTLDSSFEGAENARRMLAELH